MTPLDCGLLLALFGLGSLLLDVQLELAAGRREREDLVAENHALTARLAAQRRAVELPRPRAPLRPRLERLRAAVPAGTQLPLLSRVRG